MYIQLSGDYGFVAFLQATWIAFFPHDLDVPSWLLRPIVGAILLGSLAATFLPHRVDVVVLFAIWVCVYFLVYLSWEHSYVMLVPALVLLVGLRPDCRAITLIVFTIVALPTPYIVFTHIYEKSSGGYNSHLFWSNWASALVHGWKPVPVLALWAFLCMHELRQAFTERAGRSP